MSLSADLFENRWVLNMINLQCTTSINVSFNVYMYLNDCNN